MHRTVPLSELQHVEQAQRVLKGVSDFHYGFTHECDEPTVDVSLMRLWGHADGSLSDSTECRAGHSIVSKQG